MSDLFIGAYWPARKESQEQCAERLGTFLRECANCDPVLATWFETGRSRRQAMERPVDIGNRDYLMDLLERGRNRRDVGQTVIEELGFRVVLWNGESGMKAVGLSIKCGLYWTSATTNAGMGNSVTLDLPEALDELRQADRMSRMLAAIVRAWEPDWAGVMSTDAMNARDFNTKVPFVDWMVYVSRTIGSVPLPSSITLLEKGTLIVVQPDPPALNSEADQENIHRIEAAIR